MAAQARIMRAKPATMSPSPIRRSSGVSGVANGLTLPSPASRYRLSSSARARMAPSSPGSSSGLMSRTVRKNTPSSPSSRACSRQPIGPRLADSGILRPSMPTWGRRAGRSPDTAGRLGVEAPVEDVPQEAEGHGGDDDGHAGRQGRPPGLAERALGGGDRGAPFGARWLGGDPDEAERAQHEDGRADVAGPFHDHHPERVA